MGKETKFLNAVKRTLDEAEKSLDADTVARLRAARARAIEEGLRRPARAGWLLPVGGFATAGAVLAVAGLLWFSAASNPLMHAGVDDIDLLTAHDNPEFFVDLDFYDWLEDHNDAV